MSRAQQAVGTALFSGILRQATAAWRLVKQFAPFAAIELILPGGTVIAILCWLYRRRRSTLPARERVYRCTLPSVNPDIGKVARACSRFAA